MKRIVIFASGSGSNAVNIINHFNTGNIAKVVSVFCNRPQAGVVEKANNLRVTVRVFSKQEFNDGRIISELNDLAPDLIVLAGFLLMIPESITKTFHGKIINIHPALLPKFGGHGMFGMNVHQAVIAAKESETGITIHHVDEHYDSGDVIAQFKVALNGDESAEEIAQKVHALEYKHFPIVIEQLLK